jgi:hypothetical protein
MKENKPTGARSYLYVMPRHALDQRWHVFQLSDESPRISLADSVSTYVEVHRLARREQRPLRISGEAWQQMIAAGVAPPAVPDDVALA